MKSSWSSGDEAEGDEAWIAWIVPMREGKKIEAYALWLLSARGAPEDPPVWAAFSTVLKKQRQSCFPRVSSGDPARARRCR